MKKLGMLYVATVVLILWLSSIAGPVLCAIGAATRDWHTLAAGAVISICGLPASSYLMVTAMRDYKAGAGKSKRITFSRAATGKPN